MTKPVVALTVAITGLAELQVPPATEAVKVVDEPTQTFGPAKVMTGVTVIVMDLFTATAQGNNVLLGVKM